MSDTNQTIPIISVISQNIQALQVSQPSLETQSSLACQHAIGMNGYHNYIEDDVSWTISNDCLICLLMRVLMVNLMIYNWKTPKEIKRHSQCIAALKSDGIGICKFIPSTNHQLPPKDIVHNKYGMDIILLVLKHRPNPKQRGS